MKQSEFKTVKIKPSVHADLKMYALKSGMSLFAVVEMACLKLLKEKKKDE